jgi:hypothetical protein
MTDIPEDLEGDPRRRASATVRGFHYQFWRTVEARGVRQQPVRRPVRRPIDGDGVSRLACRSPGPAPSTREEAAHVHCGTGSWGSGGGQRLSMGDHVMGTGATRGATAAGRG